MMMNKLDYARLYDCMNVLGYSTTIFKKSYKSVDGVGNWGPFLGDVISVGSRVWCYSSTITGQVFMLVITVLYTSLSVGGACWLSLKDILWNVL